MGGALKAVQASEAWRRLAQEAMGAARCLGVDYPRSCVNRAYYAVFAETHARLLDAGLRPRSERGTWSHQDLAEVAGKHLVKTLGKAGASKYRQLLRRARQLREMADYHAMRSIDSTAAVTMLKDAMTVLKDAIRTTGGLR